MKELEKEEYLKIKAILYRSKTSVEIEAIEPCISEDTNGNINPPTEHIKQNICATLFFKWNCSWKLFSKFQV
jgi:hypothetical protein